jgi:hypothetical protein
MLKIVSAAERYLRTWCRRMADAYESWESRTFPNGDGI